MSRYSGRRYARCKVYFLAQPQCLGTRIVMIAQHPWSGLDCYVAKALRVDQQARDLRDSDSVLGADLRIFRNIDFDTRLRIRAQQQTRKNKYPKNRISQHIAISPVGVPKARVAQGLASDTPQPANQRPKMDPSVAAAHHRTPKKADRNVCAAEEGWLILAARTPPFRNSCAGAALAAH